MKTCLLHVCCGPCSIMCIEALQKEGFAVTGYFANPNIHPVSEYLRRREAMEQVATRMEIPMIWQDNVCNPAGWIEMTVKSGISGNQEYARCAYCYETRIALTAAAAQERNFDVFTTSLLYSKYQQHDIIRSLCSEYGGPRFLYRDFREYWQEGNDRARAWGLYRQNYCGCVFSEAERFAKKLARLAEKSPDLPGDH